MSPRSRSSIRTGIPVHGMLAQRLLEARHDVVGRRGRAFGPGRRRLRPGGIARAPRFQDGTAGRSHVGEDAHLRRGFVHEVHRLVGQEAVGDVALREFHRRLERRVRDLHVVVLLVLPAHAAQDLHGDLVARLLHVHAHEAPGEGRVGLDVPAVFAHRRGAEHADLAPGQRRLQDVGGVHASAAATGAEQHVQLVHEQDDVVLRRQLAQELLQPLLELALVLRPRHHGRQVHGEDPAALEERGHRVVHHREREALGDRRLAHARLAHQHRVVLAAPCEHLDRGQDLPRAPDDRIQPAPARIRRQVRAELGGRGSPAARRRRARGPGTRTRGQRLGGAQLSQRGEQPGALDVQLLARLGRQPAVRRHQRDQQVLLAHFAILEHRALRLGDLHRTLERRGDRRLEHALARAIPRVKALLQRRPRLHEVLAEVGEQRRQQAFVRHEQREEEVERVDLRLAAFARDFPGARQGLGCSGAPACGRHGFLEKRGRSEAVSRPPEAAPAP
jgi:hypothetical protein